MRLKNPWLPPCPCCRVRDGRTPGKKRRGPQYEKMRQDFQRAFAAAAICSRRLAEKFAALV
jgi:hypothetical protein